MSQHNITLDPNCGTIACHGGHYEYACQVEANTVEWAEYGTERSVLMNREHDPEQPHAGFEQGASKLARDLGFLDSSELECWAAVNPSIWGNFHGGRMFTSKLAFRTEEVWIDSGMGLQTIIDWWLAVAERLEIRLATDDLADALA